MIYTKNTIFPYPIYFNESSDYNSPKYQFDIEVSESNGYYNLQFITEIESEFLRNLIHENKAHSFIIMTSPFESKIIPFNEELNFKIDELNLSSKLRFQCFVICNQSINFADNRDLVTFYDMHRKNITVKKNGLLAFSNTVNFNGEIKKPFEIFQWAFDENLKSELEVELSKETIIIKIRSKEYKLPAYKGFKSLNNHYVYIGLQKALFQTLKDLAIETDEIIIEDEINGQNANELQFKLLNFLRTKNIDKLNYENIDEVIYKMSNNIISKQANDLRRFIEDGN